MNPSTKLKEARKAAGLTMKQAADAIGVKLETINKYECATNSRFPGFHRAKALIELYAESGSTVTMSDIGYA